MSQKFLTLEFTLDNRFRQVCNHEAIGLITFVDVSFVMQELVNAPCMGFVKRNSVTWLFVAARVSFSLMLNCGTAVGTKGML